MPGGTASPARAWMRPASGKPLVMASREGRSFIPAECVSRRITVTSWNAAVSNSFRYRPSGAFRSILPSSQSRRTEGAVAITFVSDAMSKIVSAVMSSGCGTVARQPRTLRWRT